MAGHSKWANIQHRKGRQDEKRGKVWTRIIREITVAARAGGADLLVLECVPATLAKRISAELTIPTNGIGAAVDCDGKVLVSYVMRGITPARRPRDSNNSMTATDADLDASSPSPGHDRQADVPRTDPRARPRTA